MSEAQRHVEVELTIEKGLAQMRDPWGAFKIPGLASFSLSDGLGSNCDYLTLRGTAKAIRAAAGHIGLDAAYVNQEIAEATSRS